MTALPHDGRRAPRPRKNGTHPDFVLGAVLVFVEILFLVWHRPILWLASVGSVALSLCLLAALYFRVHQAESARRLLLLMLLKSTIGIVAVTQGVHSPLTTLLLVPILFAALFIDLRTTLILSGATAAALFGVGLWEMGSSEAARIEVIRDAILFAVILGFGLIYRRMENRIEIAALQAEDQESRVQRAILLAIEEEKRVGELVWLADTARMMESLPSAEEALGAALIQLKPRITFEGAAIYLRDTERINDTCLQLNQTYGEKSDSIASNLLVHDAERLGLHQNCMIVNSQSVKDSAGTALRQFLLPVFPDAQNYLCAPLATMEEFVGLMILSRDTVPFTTVQCELVERLTQSIIYPLQRVRLQTLATTDLLTGLINQRDFRRRLRQEVERARRFEAPLSLIMMDVDRFKVVNDTYGHRAGDAVLAHIGALLRKGVRGIDITARYGGEELAVICAETEEADAAYLAERLRIALANSPVLLPSGELVTVTASFGIAEIGRMVNDMATLIDSADSALLMAKQQGRNCIYRASQFSKSH